VSSNSKDFNFFFIFLRLALEQNSLILHEQRSQATNFMVFIDYTLLQYKFFLQDLVDQKKSFNFFLDVVKGRCFLFTSSHFIVKLISKYLLLINQVVFYLNAFVKFYTKLRMFVIKNKNAFKRFGSVRHKIIVKSFIKCLQNSLYTRTSSFSVLGPMLIGPSVISILSSRDYYDYLVGFCFDFSHIFFKNTFFMLNYLLFCANKFYSDFLVFDCDLLLDTRLAKNTFSRLVSVVHGSLKNSSLDFFVEDFSETMLLFDASTYVSSF